MVRKMHYRKLPHIQVESHPLFITFRTLESVDYYIQKIGKENLSANDKFSKIEKHSHSSEKGAFLHSKVLELMHKVLLENNQLLYDLYCYSIMPNHVHIVFNLKKDLPVVLKRIKGKSARIINQQLNKTGSLWEREYFDVVIRNEKHLNATIKYVLQNPVIAGLKDASKRIWCKYDDLIIF